MRCEVLDRRRREDVRSNALDDAKVVPASIISIRLLPTSQVPRRAVVILTAMQHDCTDCCTDCCRSLCRRRAERYALYRIQDSPTPSADSSSPTAGTQRSPPHRQTPSRLSPSAPTSKHPVSIMVILVDKVSKKFVQIIVSNFSKFT